MTTKAQVMALNKFLVEQENKMNEIMETVGLLVLSLHEMEKERKRLCHYLREIPLEDGNGQIL